jgi:hypothetical protein
MEKRDVLRSTSFGKTVAEEEGAGLSAYFVETEQWEKIFAGDIDIVYGRKGSGKSAIYALLLGRASELFDRGIIIIAAENPRGTVCFKDLATNPPTDEGEFRSLWKLYFLVLIGRSLREYEISSPSARKVVELLEEARLLPRNASLGGYLRAVRDYVRRLLRQDALAVESTLELDPMTAMPSGVTGRIRFKEPSSAEESMGWVSIEHLMALANLALEESGFCAWLVLDRLDVAFAESSELERNALRSLFRVYLDLRKFGSISLKIFLRSDLWLSILKAGFREASHITRQLTICWNEASLLNLVIRRALFNNELRVFYGVDPKATMSSAEKQSGLFYRIFPNKVDPGQPLRTFTWILQHTCDGTRNTAPRELIHMLSSARDEQLRRFEVGQRPPLDEALFDQVSLIEAIPEVSRTRFEQTLCAEYPHLREYMQLLEGERTYHTVQTLAGVWGLKVDRALTIANQLTDIGFFQFMGTRRTPRFWVPYLYQSALKMARGRNPNAY